MSDLTHSAPRRDNVGFWALMFGACAAPIFWLGQLMLGYGVSALVCYGGDHPAAIEADSTLRSALIAFDAVAIVAALLGLLVSLFLLARHARSERYCHRRGPREIHGDMGNLVQHLFPARDFVQHDSVHHGAPMPALMQRLALGSGLAAIAVTLLPPVSTAADHLFAFHMLQHLLIIVVAAPILIVSRVFERFPVVALTQPVTAWIAFVGIFLFWHWPAAFQWAAGNEASRLLEQISILFGALLFWNVALSSKGQHRFSYGARALFVMTAAVATDLPGVIMVFAPRAICTMPGENAAAFGLTPLEDQQIAGMLMWVPANLIFFGIATWLFALWISDTHKPSSRVAT